MALSTHHHNSRLKQKNKKHNPNGHRSKRQISAENSGRVGVKETTQIIKKELKRAQRKQQTKQIRANKREEARNIKRQFGTADSPPFLVSIVPLSLDINPKKVLHSLTDLDNLSSCSYSDQGIAHLSCKRLKQRFSFTVPPVGDLYSTLDAVKGSDTILFVWKLGEELNEVFDLIISSLHSQGYPSVLHAVMDEEEELSSKKKLRLVKDLQLELQNKFQGNLRPYFLNKSQDVTLLLRQIGSQKLRRIFYKEKRSQVLAEKVVFEGEGSTGDLKIYGYIRSQPLSVNRLIHIPGWGDFQQRQIEEVHDPYPLDSKKHQQRMLDTYYPDPELQESLDATYDIDPMEEENARQEEEGSSVISEEPTDSKASKQKRLKGYSSYQAAWDLNGDNDKSDDDDDDDVDDFDDEEDDSQSMADDSCPALPMTDMPDTDEEDSDEEIEDSDEDKEDDKSTLTDMDNDYDANVDYKEELDYLSKLRAAREDAVYPDEMDTPSDVAARVRFQKYRGLESFQMSPWDKDDKLPLDYKKIVHLKSFMHTKNTVLKQRDGVEPGNYVCITLKDVPKFMYLDHMRCQSPLVVFAILPMEQKMSLVHMAIKSNSLGHTHPIKSKERLIFHVGFRRFTNCPVFSEHSTGSKYKFLRFFQPGDTVVATMYAPITFPTCPVTVFRERPNGAQELVATGSILYPDPNRIICKKIVLSGHPFKVSPRYSVIRYMFFSREDILWFSSIKLRTKLGRKGKIVEPVGTHGHMKCSFDKQIQNHDTIIMNLYKRVFPKWRYDPAVNRPRPFYDPVRFEREQEEEEIGQQSKKKRVHFNDSH